MVHIWFTEILIRLEVRVRMMLLIIYRMIVDRVYHFSNFLSFLKDVESEADRSRSNFGGSREHVITIGSFMMGPSGPHLVYRNSDSSRSSS